MVLPVDERQRWQVVSQELDDARVGGSARSRVVWPGAGGKELIDGVVTVPCAVGQWHRLDGGTREQASNAHFWIAAGVELVQVHVEVALDVNHVLHDLTIQRHELQWHANGFPLLLHELRDGVEVRAANLDVQVQGTGPITVAAARKAGRVEHLVRPRWVERVQLAQVYIRTLGPGDALVDRTQWHRIDVERNLPDHRRPVD